MSNEDVDTVTPLDGDGHDVVFPQEGDGALTFGNVDAEDYESRGKTTVATPRGYRFASANKDIPVIDSTGIKVTREVAAEVLAESDQHNGKVFVVEATDADDETEG